MGGCCTKSRFREARRQMERLMVEFREQRKLLSKILQFDLNMGKDPQLSIVKRLARETTNDNGDPLNVATANILLLEFKKFIFLCAIRIAHDSTN